MRLSDLTCAPARCRDPFRGRSARPRMAACVALALVGKGNQPGSCPRGSGRWPSSPRPPLLFVGVAGVFCGRTSGSGDVVVANKVYAYHGGTSENDGLKARPKALGDPARGRPDRPPRSTLRGDGATGSPPATSSATVHFGAIAAGEVVQDSAVSEQARWIRQHYNDALAIEMEAAGVAQAGHLNRAMPVVVVRGISDHADGTKTNTDGHNWQPRAARHAAAFAAALAQELVKNPRPGQPVTPTATGVRLCE